MNIPKYDEIQIPALQILKNGGQLKAKDLEEKLAIHFKLSDEERTHLYKSGNGPVFLDRINWALSYLNMAGLVHKPKRGIYEINELGREVLKTPDKLQEFVDKQIDLREPTRKKSEKNNIENETEGIEITDGSIKELTPEEILYNSFQGIKKSIYREIIDTILSKTPREFEKLVVELLQRLGYGGQVKNSGLVTKYTNDKGIDGVIKEDILGFGRIYIQAKRYARENLVGREDIQKFVGALAVENSDKGVFITTSDFNKGAYEYVSNLSSNTKIVLINGNKLSEYIYDYNLGMQTENIIELKKLDSDFWDNLQDEKS
jgi:restriction system protein